MTPLSGIVDVKNDIFRYPQSDVFHYPKSDVRFTLNIARLQRVSKTELKELGEDVEQLEKLLKALHGQVTDLKIINERNSLRKSPKDDPPKMIL